MRQKEKPSLTQNKIGCLGSADRQPNHQSKLILRFSTTGVQGHIHSPNWKSSSEHKARTRPPHLPAEGWNENNSKGRVILRWRVR